MMKRYCYMKKTVFNRFGLASNYRVVLGLCMLVVANGSIAVEASKLERSGAEASQLPPSGPSEVDDAIKSIQALQKRLASIKAMKATFTQVTTSASSSSNSQVLTGSMVVARPGRFYWKTLPPFEQLTLTDGKTLWVYDPDLEQVTLKALDKQASQTPALILTGSIEEITAAYDVYGAETSEQRWQFALIPKSKEALFDRLQLIFDQQDRLHSMMIDDGLGQTTNIRFSEVQLNPDIQVGLFNFEIPKGVDVIREPGIKPSNGIKPPN
jgi:outer membrane lipoprotein carrier protein